MSWDDLRVLMKISFTMVFGSAFFYWSLTWLRHLFIFCWYHQLEDELTAEKLFDWSYSLKLQEVEVILPKFSVQKSIEVNTYLDLSNVTDPKKADLSASTTTKDIALTHLVHDTFIEIDEEGGGKACNCSKKKHAWNALQFVADHPFIYYVLHKRTKSIVIFGRFSKPDSREAWVIKTD